MQEHEVDKLLKLKQMNIAVLLTCYNRINKTIECLDSLFKADKPDELTFDIFLLDDKSPDSTGEIISKKYPVVNVVHGEGNLFWAGGMRLIWQHAKSQKNFDGYLLLNDDVILSKSVLMDLLETHKYSLSTFEKEGLYVSTTADFYSKDLSYGGRLVKRGLLRYSMTLVKPDSMPKKCSLANANILMVMKSVVEKVGMFDNVFTHGIADYDYTLTAQRMGFPLLVSPNIGGYCTDDHGNNWLSDKSTLKQRLQYLYSPKGLAYKENLYYIKKHFPMQLPYYFSMFWLKTFFPKIWDKFK